MKVKCLFVHDHVFSIYGNEFYSEGKITDSTLSRYVNGPQDETHVLSRARVTTAAKEVDSLTKISTRRVMFHPVKGAIFPTIFGRNILHNLFLVIRVVNSCDFLVVRLPSFLGVFALIVNFIAKKKYFLEVVGDPKEALLAMTNGRGRAYKVFVSLFSAVNKKLILHADGVIYVTQNYLQKKYPARGLQSFASNVDVSVSKLDLHLERYDRQNVDELQVGLIGSFNNEYKGIGCAIEAISILKKRGVSAKLNILGSGKLKNQYMQLAKNLGLVDAISFDGTLTGENEINGWLDQLDVYIQPSLSEGLPRALIEAMARGLPSIATDVGGIPELLPVEFLIPPNEATILADKIFALSGSSVIRYETGVYNYNKAKEYDRDYLNTERSKFWTAARSLVFTHDE